MLFKFYFTEQTHDLLQSGPMDNTMALDADQRTMLESYEEVDNFPFMDLRYGRDYRRGLY